MTVNFDEKKLKVMVGGICMRVDADLNCEAGMLGRGFRVRRCSEEGFSQRLLLEILQQEMRERGEPPRTRAPESRTRVRRFCTKLTICLQQRAMPDVLCPKGRHLHFQEEGRQRLQGSPSLSCSVSCARASPARSSSTAPPLATRFKERQ